ncbi:MAG: PorP/SprF family type IX secretion system membrane protein [Bacteroidia bacterium]|nr:PorP/SprF family type IX secretion system membrane protein [Bacteroidia bacterium]
MKLKLALLIIIAGASNILAQDPHFSQWHSSKLTLNPSLAGANGCMNADVTYRDQWPKLSGYYKTTLVSWDQYFKKLHGGMGAYFMYDEAGGKFFTSRAAIAYAPVFKLLNEKLFIVPSVEFAFQEKKIDWSSLTFGDQIDPKRGFVYNTLPDTYKTKSDIFDLSTGLLIVANHFYAGFSAYHITKPDEAILQGTHNRLPTRFTFHAGYTFGGNDSSSKFSVTPGIIYVIQQDFRITLPGIKACYRNFSLSFAYRNEDAFIVATSFRLKWINLGYSYDYTVSKLYNSSTGGTHEIHLGVSFKNKRANGLFLKNMGL